jgi:hypothetical protein
MLLVRMTRETPNAALPVKPTMWLLICALHEGHVMHPARFMGVRTKHLTPPVKRGNDASGFMPGCDRPVSARETRLCPRQPGLARDETAGNENRDRGPKFLLLADAGGYGAKRRA